MDLWVTRFKWLLCTSLLLIYTFQIFCMKYVCNKKSIIKTLWINWKSLLFYAEWFCTCFWAAKWCHPDCVLYDSSRHILWEVGTDFQIKCKNNNLLYFKIIFPRTGKGQHAAEVTLSYQKLAAWGQGYWPLHSPFWAASFRPSRFVPRLPMPTKPFVKLNHRKKEPLSSS